MDRAQDLLFGDTPRRVGTPAQHWVFNTGQIDLMLEDIGGRRNAYATLGTLPIVEDEPESIDKVLFDLDSPAKAGEEDEGEWLIFDGTEREEPDDKEVIERMREDEEIREQVLGAPANEAQELARASADDGVPVVGVFSGFGIHIHQLYEETEDPEKAMTTTAAKYIDELGLKTPDWAIVGQVERLCRIPNVERVTMPGPRHIIVDGEGTGLYTIPLTQDELMEITPADLLEMSTEPRVPDGLVPDDRPQMAEWTDYQNFFDDDGDSDAAERPQKGVAERTTPIEEEWVKETLYDLIHMPCMVERITSPNPHHEVRQNVAVMLYNVGLNRHQVEAIYEKLGWIDWDREVTRYQLKHIWEKGYSDMSCATIRSRGLCEPEYHDDPESCPTYGWSGGRAEWKNNDTTQYGE
jgi:hypothetical protein